MESNSISFSIWAGLSDLCIQYNVAEEKLWVFQGQVIRSLAASTQLSGALMLVNPSHLGRIPTTLTLSFWKACMCRCSTQHAQPSQISQPRRQPCRRSHLAPSRLVYPPAETHPVICRKKNGTEGSPNSGYAWIPVPGNQEITANWLNLGVVCYIEINTWPQKVYYLDRETGYRTYER